MKQVNIWKCDFCKKTSFQKGLIKKHEKICFYNPETQSCATCLWLSTNHVSDPSGCCVGESFEPVKGSKPTLRTKCNKWINIAAIEGIEVMENEYGILSQILSGDPKTFETISRIKVGGTSYSGE